MERSLSALLPVRNVESTLEGSVLELLEVLPELTSRLDLVIVDDCSCDATIEVADELLGRYPQLSVVRHASPKGRAAAIAGGLRRCRGEIILLADEDCELTLGEIRKMWDALERHELVLGRPAAARRLAWPPWKTSEPCGQGGFQMGYRRAFVSLAPAMTDQATLLAHLQRCGCQWHEVELGGRLPRVGPHCVAATARNLFAPHGQRTQRSQRADAPQPTTSRPKPPNYLTRLRDFALGE